ncbi:LexA family transcriptional regulator [Sinorhizobium fredii]|uniref:LexA family transcriptional regulator n=1 Tax=Rhizobium fredii TaxID=380 RepID=UPI00210B3864|nr:XRE family transcriptional regulator [Sinorhizobium fredii]UTY50448.1 XRE family transcriptional regulator [Sinorhizobium fredii]
MKNDFFDTASKTYVRFVLDELKLSPSALAKKAGIASTTLTRALNDPTHKYTLSMSTLGKIVKVSGISPNPFFESKDFVDMSMVPFASPNLYDESWGEGANATEGDISENDAHATLVIGEAAAGVWKAPELTRIEDGGLLTITLPRYRSIDVFGLKMGDDTCAPYIQRGEYAICVRRQAMKREPDHGDLVVIERWRDRKSLMEISIRRLIVPPTGGPYLRFDNPDTRISERIDLPLDLDDTGDLRIIGDVSYAVRSVGNPILRDELIDRILMKRGYGG